MKNSFESLTRALMLPGQKAAILLPLAGLTALAWAGKEFVNRPLETSITPAGLTSIALSGDSKTIEVILRSWTQAGLIPQAFFALGLQFLWVLLLSATLFFACIWASQKLPAKRWHRAGTFLAWGQWAGALYGAAGAVFIGFFLGGRVSSPLPDWALLCTVGEMAIFLAGALYSTAGLVARELPRSTWFAFLLR